MNEVLEGVMPVANVSSSIHLMTKDAASRSYGDSNVHGGARVYGNLHESVFFNRYFASSQYQSAGQDLIRSIKNPETSLLSQPLSGEQRSHSEGEVPGSCFDSSHRLPRSASCDTSHETSEIQQELQEGLSQIKQLSLESYCDILRF